MTFKIRDGLYATTSNESRKIVFTTDAINYDIVGIWHFQTGDLEKYNSDGTFYLAVFDFEQVIRLLSKKIKNVTINTKYFC
jgi:hypothetical protein